MKKLIQGKKNVIIILLVVAGLFALAASWTLAKTNGATPLSSAGSSQNAVVGASGKGTSWSKAVFSVDKLSCGACVDNIKKAVATLPGTGEVMVDLSDATAEVLFDTARIEEPKTIAKVITDAGYPAEVKNVLSSDQLSRELAEAKEKVKAYIASVGRRDVPRKDFEIERGHARMRYEQIYGAETFSTAQGKQLMQRIESQIVLRLVDEAVKLQEVDRAGYALPEGKADQALTDFVKEKKTTLDTLKQDMASNGYPFDYFKQKFENRVKLQGYLEDIVLADSIDPQDRQQRYTNWLSNARTLAKVVYYDKNLETLVKSGSGGGCSGGSCSVRQ